MNPRHVAALDLVGSRGTVSRRRLVLAEFLAATAAGLLVGGWLMVGGRPVGCVLGAWCVGIGANYGILAGHALHLLRGDRLAAERAAIPDLQGAARRYTVYQVLLVVPFAVLVCALSRLGHTTRVPRS